MENKKLISFLTTCAAIIFTAVIPVSALSEGKNFSFHFERCTVTDALKEISTKSGVDIISNGTIKKEILKKSYVNRSLDSIIADLIRGENCAVVWNYNDGNLFSIDLFTPDEDTARKSLAGSSRNRSTIRDIDRGQVPGDIDISEINAARADFIRNREVTRSYRLNRNSSNSRRSVGRSASNRINTNSNTASNTSSHVSANIRRASNNSQNNEEEQVLNPQPLPVSPEPENGNGLEPPPMPPGL